MKQSSTFRKLISKEIRHIYEDKEGHKVQNHFEHDHLNRTMTYSSDGEDYFFDENNHLVHTKKKKTRRCIILPDSKFILYWEFVINILLIYECTVNPFRLAFFLPQTQFYNTLDGIVTIGFFLDIVVNFRKAYYNEQSKLVRKGGEIANSYLRSWFLVDLVATIPFQYLSNTFLFSKDVDASRLIRSIRFYKVLKMYKMLRLVRLAKMYKN